MSQLIPKKISLLVVILILASWLPATFGGRLGNWLQKKEVETVPLVKAAVSDEVQLQTQKEALIFHRRLLKVQTKDYETYDPTPALNKPPAKEIPN